jgi:hypothetical protein
MVVCLQVAAAAAANFGTKTTASLLFWAISVNIHTTLDESTFRKHTISQLPNSVHTKHID